MARAKGVGDLGEVMHVGDRVTRLVPPPAQIRADRRVIEAYLGE